MKQTVELMNNFKWFEIKYLFKHKVNSMHSTIDMDTLKISNLSSDLYWMRMEVTVGRCSWNLNSILKTLRWSLWKWSFFIFTFHIFMETWIVSLKIIFLRMKMIIFPTWVFCKLFQMSQCYLNLVENNSILPTN